MNITSKASLSAALLVAAIASGAADPPHWTNAASTIDCVTQCHTPHNAPGSGLTSAAGNVNLCQSCHNSSGMAKDLAVNNSDKAIPGISGSSHAFDASSVNTSCGAGIPADADMYRLSHGFGDRIVCSTCHDQHFAVSSKGGYPHTSAAKMITALGSTGTATSGGTYAGANGSWYLVEIQTAGALGAARFRWSKDNGVSWMGSNIATAAGPLTLDNGITVSFSAGNYVLQERWQFYASWPFLRIAADSGTNATGSKLCRDCHSSWVQSSARVEGADVAYPANGTNLFSHPVGEGLLNAYDRSAGSAPYSRNILDGNGQAQGVSTEGNPGNDLNLDAGGNVQCLSCHAMHFAPSNTNAVIP